jgi:hypothetical protein
MADPQRYITIDEWRAAAARRHKYGAHPCVLDGARFDSAAEARRYRVLQLAERAGAITDLVRQPAFPIHAATPAGPSERPVCEYRADFAYTRDGVRIVEDVKGCDTDLSKLKRKFVLAQYGVVVTLIREV